MKTELRMVKGDITLAEVDAIVNSSNNDLVLGGGVSGTINRVAGTSVQEECSKIGTVPLGMAVVTGAGLLKAEWIIHAAVNPLGLWADAKSVRKATKNVLKIAEEKKVRTLAFPAVGTGAGALSVETCANILIEEITLHCKDETTSIEEVQFVIYDDKTFEIFEEKFNEKLHPDMEIKPEVAKEEPAKDAEAPKESESPAVKAEPAPKVEAKPAVEAPKEQASAAEAPPAEVKRARWGARR